MDENTGEPPSDGATRERRDPTTPGESVDPEELQRQLTEIRGAMGLDERYPGQRRMWLVYGIVVGVATILTNVLFALDISTPAYIALWFGMAGVIGAAQVRLVSRTADGARRSGPDFRLLGVILVGGLVTLWTSVSDVLAATTVGAARGAHYFSHLVMFLGIGLAIGGAVLKTQQIRRRDRLPFLIGGAWMLALAAVLPHVRYLQLFGYSVFGVAFLLHSLAAYRLTAPN